MAPEPSLAWSLPDGLDTPVPVVDLDVLDANVQRMTGALASRGVALRPHFKTPRMIEVVRRQLAEGAVGITCATLGEAEALVQAGVDDIFIAYPIWLSDVKARRLSSLLERASISVGLDSREGAEGLAAALGNDRGGPGILIEIDSGDRRTGVAPAEAGALASDCSRMGLRVVGVFTHGGHGYEPGCGDQAGDDEVAALGAAAASLEANGLTPAVVSAGSTPTALRSAHGPVTEERPGTYVFGDRQQVGLGSCAPSDVALAVAATVVSTSVAGQFVIDAGAKSLAKDRPAWLNGFGHIPAWPSAVITRIFDHHAVCEEPPHEAVPRVGDVVAVVPNHVCPVVNLAHEVIVARGGRETGRWRVLAHTQ